MNGMMNWILENDPFHAFRYFWGQLHRAAKANRDAKYRQKHKAELREYDRAFYLEYLEEKKTAAQRYRKEHPDRVRETSWRYNDLPSPTRPMPALCECCGGPPGKRSLHNDHCHETGKFRGWICGKCNKALGLLGDNEAAVLRALEYLRRTR